MFHEKGIYIASRRTEEMSIGGKSKKKAQRQMKGHNSEETGRREIGKKSFHKKRTLILHQNIKTKSSVCTKR